MNSIETGRNKEETAMEYIQRAHSWMDQNPESSELPTIESVFELFNLISKTYDVSLLDEVYEAIEDGAGPEPLCAFIIKYNLDWSTTKGNVA